MVSTPVRVRFGALLVSITASLAPACSSSTASSPANGSTDAGDAGAAETGPGAEGGADAGSSDALPDVDNGAPSKTYPAPHPPMPQITNTAGGAVLTAPKVMLVFYPGYPYETELDDFAKGLVASDYWKSTTSEYGVGPLTYAGMRELTGQSPPATVSSVDLRTWFAAQLLSGALGTPDPQTIYTLYFPPTTTISEPDPILPGAVDAQCTAFGGYHDAVTVTVADGGAPQSFAFAIIPYCTTTSFTIVDGLSAVTSHEWVEAATDPFQDSGSSITTDGGPQSAFYSVDGDHLVWDALLGSGEAGDMCFPEGMPVWSWTGVGGHVVQRTWSNALARAGHDPCAPSIPGAFFDAAPVLTETVAFQSTFAGSFSTKGVAIPVGQKKTIEVDLFSDADTGGPWTVEAQDGFYAYYKGYGAAQTLALTWDRTQGQNGEKLHLTIEVIAKSQFGNAHPFIVRSTLGNRQAYWPGLVVE